MLQAALPAASRPLADGLEHARRVDETRGQFEAVRVNLETLSYARQSYRVRSYNLWNALAEIDAVHTLARQRIANEERLVRDDRVTGPVLAIARERLEEFASNLVQPVYAAVEALGSERG